MLPPTLSDREIRFKPALTQALLDRIEERFRLAMRRILRRQVEAWIALLGKEPSLTDIYLLRSDPNLAAEALAARESLYAGMMRLGIATAAAEMLDGMATLRPSFGADQRPETRDQRPGTAFAGTLDFEDLPIPQDGLDWYQARAVRLAGVKDQELLGAVRGRITDGVMAGEAQGTMIGGLRSLLDGFSGPRLENIVRTESSLVYGAGRMMAMQGNPLIGGYEISAVLDDRLCPLCEPFAGRQVTKAEIEGRLPPLHYMCRCVALPIFAYERLDESRRIAPDLFAMPGFGRLPAAVTQQAGLEIAEQLAFPFAEVTGADAIAAGTPRRVVVTPPAVGELPTQAQLFPLCRFVEDVVGDAGKVDRILASSGVSSYREQIEVGGVASMSGTIHITDAAWPYLGDALRDGITGEWERRAAKTLMHETLHGRLSLSMDESGLYWHHGCHEGATEVLAQRITDMLRLRHAGDAEPLPHLLARPGDEFSYVEWSSYICAMARKAHPEDRAVAWRWIVKFHGATGSEMEEMARSIGMLDVADWDPDWEPAIGWLFEFPGEFARVTVAEQLRKDHEEAYGLRMEAIRDPSQLDRVVKRIMEIAQGYTGVQRANIEFIAGEIPGWIPVEKKA